MTKKVEDKQLLILDSVTSQKELLNVEIKNVLVMD